MTRCARSRADWDWGLGIGAECDSYACAMRSQATIIGIANG
ncbi:hypothetical protein [Scytonema sp. UIC 10036]|nr:hypothetical protein [Scytonema sp. UIC 10036]